LLTEGKQIGKKTSQISDTVLILYRFQPPGNPSDKATKENKTQREAIYLEILTAMQQQRYIMGNIAELIETALAPISGLMRIATAAFVALRLVLFLGGPGRRVQEKEREGERERKRELERERAGKPRHRPTAIHPALVASQNEAR
jgi:predicted XRE-type DNA-binding protein